MDSAPLNAKDPRVRRAGRVALWMAALALTGYLLQLGLTPVPGGGTTRPAPHFAVRTLDSVVVERTLNDYAGHPLLVNIWATWCDPCREEMPSLERLYKAYRDRGLRIAAISVDERGNEGLIREFAKENGLTFDILHDPTSAVMSQFGLRGVPETFLISDRGMIVGHRYVADWASAESRALVDSLLFRRSP